jgi:hypothetical protein
MGRGGYDPAVDALPIHETQDLLEGLSAFLVDERPLAACRYCLGYVGKKREHGQLQVRVQKDPSLEPVTRATHLSRYRFAKEMLAYLGRRSIERMTGRRIW